MRSSLAEMIAAVRARMSGPAAYTAPFGHRERLYYRSRDRCRSASVEYMKFFWSWQSDTPGKAGRYFVRDALLGAIKQLRQPEDVEEPTTAAHREAMELTSDRQGVTGSPPLAATIKRKIGECEVFVADITPVAKVPRRKGVKEKRNMNINVGIELGYAMRAHGEEQLLLVLNDHYGGREHLPFHLQDLGGPITYSLPPDATQEQIDAEMPKLRGKFVVAIREFLKKKGPQKESELTFKRVPSTTSIAAWFSPGESIADFDSQTSYAFEDDKGVYLRVSPRASPARPFTSGELLGAARQRHMGLLWRTQAGLPHGNAKGAIVIEPVSGNGGRVRAASQVFHSGEIWGIGRDLLCDNEHGQFISVWRLEEAMRYGLEGFVQFLEKLGLAPPYDVEFGVVGVKGFSLVIENNFDNPYAIYQDDFSDKLVLSSTTPQAIDEALLLIYESFFRMTGHTRPDHLFDFPARRRG